MEKLLKAVFDYVRETISAGTTAMVSPVHDREDHITVMVFTDERMVGFLYYQLEDKLLRKEYFLDNTFDEKEVI